MVNPHNCKPLLSKGMMRSGRGEVSKGKCVGSQSSICDFGGHTQ